MPPTSNGGRSGGRNNGKKNDPMLENLRGACPPHKRKDLDKLYKQMNGDEEKIMARIQEWWEEPAEQEEVWEDVNKKAVKKKYERVVGRGEGRGRGRGAGSGGRGGGREKGRGSEGRGRGPPPKKEGKEPKPENGENTETTGKPAPPPAQPGVPAPVENSPALKGAWGARAAAVAPAPPAPPATPIPETPKKPLQEKAEEPSPVPTTNPLDVVLLSQADPMPSGRPASESKPVVRSAPRVGGNVWATKGSAHLIQAEKPRAPTASVPATVPSTPPAPIAPAPLVVEMIPEPLATLSVPEPSLDGGLQTGMSGTGAWGNSASAHKVEPAPVPVPLEMPVVAPVPRSAPPVVEPPVAVSPEPKSVPPPASPVPPTNVLNMGHWETGDVGDSQNLDFGFGSFGADADVSVDNNVTAPAKEPEPPKTTAASPARPPPGLSLGGMPPMPESAVMVHELENKMESASLNAQKETRPMSASLPPTAPTQAQILPGAGLPQQNYSQYGMPGMYNYSAGTGFVGMTPAGPVLASGVVPGQPGKPQATGINQSGAPGVLPQQGLYGGTQPPSAPSPGVGPDLNAESTTPGPTSGAAIPPGMPGAIPYANPALAHYGQHQFYMGQHQGGIGYNYGYGQFGGVAQGGFAYQPVMGQNQAYGAPHYDEHSGQTSHQPGGSGGYHKNSGGYRGRNNHQNQYQYNPQHGGYGGQPYGMGYHNEHFNQRGGYGPGGMGDPYAMQQGMHGGYDDDHQKGKKSGRGNNNSLPQFQQGGPPHQLGGQQGFGLQGQSSEAPSSGGGWSNNQGGGWSGGAPSWQGSN